MSIPPKFQLNISYGSRVIEFFLLVSAKLHIGSSSSRESTSSRGDNYNAYHKLAVALAEVLGSAIDEQPSRHIWQAQVWYIWKYGVLNDYYGILVNTSGCTRERYDQNISISLDILINFDLGG